MDEKETSPKTADPLWELCLLDECSVLTTGIAALIVSAGVNFRTGPLFRSLIDNPDISSRALLGSGLLFATGAIASCIRTVCFSRAEVKLRNTLSLRAFSSLLRIKGNSAGVGSQLSLVRDDATVVAEFWSQKFQNCLRYLSSIVGGSAMCITVAPQLALYTLPAVFILSYKCMRRTKEDVSASTNKVLRAKDAAMDFCEVRLSQAGVIRTFGATERETNNFELSLRDWAHLGTKAGCSRGIFMGTIDIAMKGMLMSLIYFGGRLVKRNNITAGQLAQFILHTVMISMGLYGINGTYMDSIEARESARRIIECEERAQDATVAKTKCLNAAPAQISFRNVFVRYPGEDIDALKDVSFDIKAGQVVGLVGESGSGKSTIIGLLNGEISPMSGTIQVNGRDLMPNESVSSVIKVTWLPQQPTLFGRSVRDAVQLGDDEANTNDVTDALQNASASEFLAERSLELDTPLVGSQFSGGETGRLCLARAYCGKSALILLDEPCAGLDGPTAQEVVKGFYERKTTCVLTTHQLQHFEHTDVIFVVSDGRIVQQSTYKELSAKSGEFSRLNGVRHPGREN
eukprot:GEMP01032898.1.p1 GENE.GEMP01032898.1~~GEMP01032898.1.p1  ORF type:complete len:573 (+),score=80.00 GEMP01032898.1:39-1757(+)